jgi:hypothetical protein
MSYAMRYISQVYNERTGKVVAEETVYSKTLIYPQNIDELGLRHADQIDLLKASQDTFLKAQLEIIPVEIICPNCGRKTRKGGTHTSVFHDVFTDHEVKMKRFSCTCGWRNKYTVQGLYGSSSHPELVKLQVERGAETSYIKASESLNNECKTVRKINSDVNIMNKVTKVGSLLNNVKQAEKWVESPEKTLKLTLTTDGGHVQDKAEGKQSFEELISTAFKPEDLVAVTKNRNEIKNKICVGSAKSDKQVTIKQLTLNACKKLGMTTDTEITALTDGANNCWSVVNSLTSYCESIITILDWFHIGKHFKSRESKIPDLLKGKYNKAKWHLFHGHPKSGLVRLKQVKNEADDPATDEVIDWLINYIGNNTEHIVDYHNRKLKKLSYTSQLAETSVNSVINSRQKNKKMRWTREGAHNILQIRTSRYSETWDSDWCTVKNVMYKNAA